jgi:excisionase family DNA binding protein
MPRLTMEEATAKLGVDRRTVYRYIDAGKVRAFKNQATGHVHVEEDDVDRLLAEREEWIPVKPKKKPAKRKS